MKLALRFVFLLISIIAIAHVSPAVVNGRGPGGPGSEPPVFDCTDKLGYYTDLWKNCEVYYLCREDGVKVTYGCPNQPHQTYFDEAISECVLHFKCPDPVVSFFF